MACHAATTTHGRLTSVIGLLGSMAGVFLILSSAAAEPSEAGPHPPPLPTGRNPTAGRTVGTEEMREHDLMTSTIERPEHAKTTGVSASTLGTTPVPFDSIGVEPALVEVLASQGITTPSPSKPSPSRTPWPAGTCAARLRPDPARRWPSESRSCSGWGAPEAHRARRPRAAWCSSRPGARRAGARRPAPVGRGGGLQLTPSTAGLGWTPGQARWRRRVIVATPGRLIDLGDRGDVELS